MILERRRRARRAARTAGISAEDRFQEGLRAYRKKVRPILFAMLAPFFLGGVALAALLEGAWDFLGGGLVGSAVAFFVWADEPPAFIENWRLGFEGERKTAKALAALPRDSWHVLHDIPGERGNRDHIVIGPPGIFLVDTKNLGGEVSVSRGTMTVRRLGIPGFDYSVPQGRWAQAAAARLRRELKGVHAEQPSITAMVALWSRFPQTAVMSGGVAYVHGSVLADRLRGRPTTLSEEEVALWARRIQALAEQYRREADAAAAA